MKRFTTVYAGEYYKSNNTGKVYFCQHDQRGKGEYYLVALMLIQSPDETEVVGKVSYLPLFTVEHIKDFSYSWNLAKIMS